MNRRKVRSLSDWANELLASTLSNWAMISSGLGPRLWFQAVSESKRTKNRVHLDLSCDHGADEVRRLEALGARRATEQPRHDLIVMADPEGNEFCLIPLP